MERNISLVSLLCFIIFNGCLVLEADAAKCHHSEKIKLIHRHSPELGHNPGTTIGPPKNSEERLKQLVQSDKARLHAIQRKLGVVGMEEDRAEFPLRSGADIGIGQYFVSFRMGTPTQRFTMLADTGSCLTWLKCRYMCDECLRSREGEKLFFPNQSTTFSSIPCSTSYCKSQDRAISVASCPFPTAPCLYSFSYFEGSAVEGSYFNDTVKFRFSNGQKMALNMTMGCTDGIYLRTSFNKVDGVLALGHSNNSFAVKAAREFGGKFSFCLVDHWKATNKSNYLIFGREEQLPGMQFTDLLFESSPLNIFYPVKVTGISVNGTMLDIPSYVWDMKISKDSGGMIVDSGTTVTHLVEPAYVKVIAALEPSLRVYKKIKGNLDYCFFFPRNEVFDEKSIPQVVIHFAGGAKLEPPVTSYIFDDADDVKCVGFKKLSWPAISMLGNVLMQNHLWEFDIANKRLGFAPSNCLTD